MRPLVSFMGQPNGVEGLGHPLHQAAGHPAAGREQRLLPLAEGAEAEPLAGLFVILVEIEGGHHVHLTQAHVEALFGPGASTLIAGAAHGIAVRSGAEMAAIRAAFEARSPLPGLPFDTLIDVRSPAEYAEDHVPGAINLPALNDAERARVGTIYVQDSAFRARKIGAALVALVVRRGPALLARFSGAGFRGSCVALIDPAAQDGAWSTVVSWDSALSSSSDVPDLLSGTSTNDDDRGGPVSYSVEDQVH